jgi:uncharacterized phage infection (PIP) family protein YhgE
MTKNPGLLSLILTALLLAQWAAAAPAPTPSPADKPNQDASAPDKDASAAPEAKAPEAPKAAAPKPAAVEAAPKAPEAAKELTPCAKSLTPLAESYKKAYDGMQKWIAQVDDKTSAVNAKIDKLQEQIQQNEASITKLKLEGGKQAAARGRELDKENKRLWTALSAARKEKSALCSGFSRDTAAMVKLNSADINEKLQGSKAEMK